MRIISGIAKSRKIKMDSKLGIRPVSDRVKQSLFEILKYDITGAVVLDLFAGTGSLGLEAASRGAKEVFFAEKDARCLKLIEGNVKNLGFSKICKIIKGDASLAIKNLKDNKYLFNIIIADPPYQKDLIKKTLQNLSGNDILNSGGIIVLKRHKKETVDAGLKYEVIKERNYGDTVLTFLRGKE